ncbi:hypothetical protein CCYA_CCYA07G2058 [Cyanidiococcus yangmingshanensis]|nr:hypothetical protein CCYA_CCYA07G2058 [Cyanidiococcus yangmingshanensis]
MANENREALAGQEKERKALSKQVNSTENFYSDSGQSRKEHRKEDCAFAQKSVQARDSRLPFSSSLELKTTNASVAADRKPDIEERGSGALFSRPATISSLDREEERAEPAKTIKEWPGILRETEARPSESENPLYLHTNSPQATLSIEETSLLSARAKSIRAFVPVRQTFSRLIRFLWCWTTILAEHFRERSFIEQYGNWIVTVLAGALLLYLLTLTICILYAVLCLFLAVLVLLAGAVTATIFWIAIVFAVSIPTFGIALLSLLGITSITFAATAGWSAFKIASIRIDGEEN